MGALSDAMEDDLRAILDDERFRIAWANWRTAMLPGMDADMVAGVWDYCRQAATTIAASLGLYSGNPMYGADVWKRLMIEAGLLS